MMTVKMMTARDVEAAIRLVYTKLSNEDVSSVGDMMVAIGVSDTIADESVTLFCWLALAAAINSIREVEVSGLAERKREDMGVILKAAKGKR